MRKMKRFMAVVMAAVMMLGMGVTGIDETTVRASEPGEGTEAEYPVITGITAAVPDLVTLPLRFNVGVGVKAPENCRISTVLILYMNTITKTPLVVQKDFYEDETGMWVPGLTGGTVDLEVERNEYATAGEYRLEGITIRVDGESDYYEYAREIDSNLFKARKYAGANGETLAEYDTYTYDGCADFTIDENANADTSRPLIQSVSVVTDPVSTSGEIELSVAFTEEGSGVKRVGAQFMTEDGQWEYFEDNFEEGVCTGSRTITSQGSQLRTLEAEYILNFISIEDYAGNITDYQLNDTKENLTAWDNQGNELTPINAVSFVVTAEPKAEWLEVTGVRIQEGIDRQQMAAGDSFDAIVIFQNNTDTEQTIQANSCYFGWSSSAIAKMWDQQNQKITIPKGGSADLTFSFNIGKFVQKGTCALTSISYNQGIYHVDYNLESDRVYGSVSTNNGNPEMIPGFVYGKEAELTIVKSDTPDEEAPYIHGLEITTTDIKAPGPVKMKVKADDGNAKIKNIELTFQNVTAPGNRISIRGTRGEDYYLDDSIYYSDKNQCYIMESQLYDNVIKGEYRLIIASFLDEANQQRYYSEGPDGTLVDGQGNTLDSLALTVAEAAKQDTDFDGPVLESVEAVSTDATLPGQVQYKVKANDAMGITDISVSYKMSNNTYRSFPAENLKAEGEYYNFYITLDKYIPEGIAELQSIVLTDGAYGANIGIYHRENDRLKYFRVEGSIEVPYSGEADLNLKWAVPDPHLFVINDPQLNTKLNKLPESTTVTIIGMYPDGMTNLPKEVMQTIKEKKFKVRMIMPSGADELVFDGADLTPEMAEELYYVVGEAWRYPDSIYFGNAQDEAGYGFILDGEKHGIPMMLRYAVDADFYETYKNKNVRLSKYSDQTGFYEVCMENLAMSAEDGNYYVDIPLESSENYSWEQYAISAGTKKFYDYNLGTEAWTQSASNEAVKGNEFTYSTRISNPNKETLKDILVFPEMMDLENGQEIIIDGKYQMSVLSIEEPVLLKKSSLGTDGKVTITPEGDAVITELKPGESVELAVTVEVPKELDTERIEMNTYSVIATEGPTAEEPVIEALGSDSFKLTLRQPKTVTKGDIDGSGEVDLGDLLYMLQVVSEQRSAKDLTAEQIQAGDIEGADGEITMGDLLIMLQYISEQRTTLP